MGGFGAIKLFEPIRYRFRVVAALPATGVPGDVLELRAGGNTSLYIWNADTAAWQAIILNNVNVGAVMQDQAYNAGDFTASGAMTWTVQAGDLVAFRYGLQGKLLFLSIQIATSSVGGVVDFSLKIQLPGGFTASKFTATAITVVDNNVYGAGWAYINAATQTIFCEKVPSLVYTLSANLTRIALQMAIEVN